MNRDELAASLLRNHIQFIEYINGLSEYDFLFSREEKWTAGQQMNHLLLSVKPITQIFMLPNFIIRVIFGKSNRSGRTYDEVVAKYKIKLQSGGRASGRFLPAQVSYDEKEKISDTLIKTVNKLINQIQKISDKDLDEMILPHPLLGKLTLREMIYFTIYHVEHHLEITKRNLGQHVSLSE